MLYNNFPNPFNPSTTIRYELPFRTQVSLRLYNSLGQLVRVLVNVEQDAGEYQLVFNGQQLASGIYFYQMMAGGYVNTKILTLLK